MQKCKSDSELAIGSLKAWKLLEISFVSSQMHSTMTQGDEHRARNNKHGTGRHREEQTELNRILLWHNNGWPGMLCSCCCCCCWFPSCGISVLFCHTMAVLCLSLYLSLWLTMMCIIFANKLEQDTWRCKGINFCVYVRLRWHFPFSILLGRAIWLKLHLLIYDNDYVQLQSLPASAETELPKQTSNRVRTCLMLVIIAYLGAGPWLWGL